MFVRLGKARLHLPSSYHQLFLRWSWSNFGVNVHSEQSTSTVKNGGQGAHKGGQHDWQHQTPQTWNTKIYELGWAFSEESQYVAPSIVLVWPFQVSQLRVCLAYLCADACLPFSCNASRVMSAELWKRYVQQWQGNSWAFRTQVLLLWMLSG